MSKYQQLLDEVPDDWEVVPISKLGKVVSGGTPTRDVSAFWGGNIPWITPGEVSKIRSKLVYKTSENITEHGLNSSGANLLPENSLLVTSRATLGARVVNAIPMTTNQGFKSIIFHQGKDSGFYYHFFDKVVGEMERRASGTTFLEISGGEFSSILLPSPLDEEKKTIATILDTLDTQIRQTEAIIAKLQQVKQGLLHDLLTRGIDENGQLRPPYEQAPKLYKESPLGWVPKEWEIKLVSQEVEIKHGFAFDGSLFTQVPEGPILLVPGNFHRDGGLYFNKSNTKYFSGKYLDEYVLQEGDCVCVMTDLSPQTLILGRAAVLAEGQKLLHNQRIGKFLFKSQEEWDVNFFSVLINQDSFRRKVINNATGTTVRHTSPSKIMSGLIVKPSKSEQDEIIKRVESFLDKTNQEVESLEKLKKQKAGLMDDLLTGRVRVTELIEQEKQAS